MANIFINGLNSKTGGGKSILNNYLTILKENDSENNYYVLTPQKSEYLKYENSFIKIVDIKDIYKKSILFVIAYKYILPRLISKLNIDVIFNLADIPIPSKNTKQVFLFDWPYAVYPESKVWQMMDMKSYIMRKIKLYFFIKYIKHITTMIAQTDTIKNRLERLYSIENIEVVPNAVSLDNMDGGEYYDFKLPEGKKLLYLTYYYPHKNLEIFIPLAQEIKKRGLDFKLIITIEESQHPKVKTFLDQIEEFSLENIIYNIGPVNMENVPSLYKQCDGLLMPTLLESFSGTYVEAMYHKIPIFTSDIDFASGVCEDSAFYFDPFESDEILNQLNTAFSNNDLKNTKLQLGTEVLNNLLNWEEAFVKYNTIIKGEIT